MVVIEHQPAALLVGPEERQVACAGIVGGVQPPHTSVGRRRTRSRCRVASNHMSGTNCTLSPLVRARFSCGGSPLVRRSIADPGGSAAVEVEGGAVLRVRRTRSHVGCVHGDEQVASGTCGKQVLEKDAYWPVLLSKDRRSEIRRCTGCRRADELAVARAVS